MDRIHPCFHTVKVLLRIRGWDFDVNIPSQKKKKCIYVYCVHIFLMRNTLIRIANYEVSLEIVIENTSWTSGSNELGEK